MDVHFSRGWMGGESGAVATDTRLTRSKPRPLTSPVHHRDPAHPPQTTSQEETETANDISDDQEFTAAVNGLVEHFEVIKGERNLELYSENRELLEMIAGYLAYRLKKIEPEKASLYGSLTKAVSFSGKNWLYALSRGSLMKPTEKCMQYVLKMEEEFIRFHGGLLGLSLWDPLSHEKVVTSEMVEEVDVSSEALAARDPYRVLVSVAVAVVMKRVMGRKLIWNLSDVHFTDRTGTMAGESNVSSQTASSLHFSPDPTCKPVSVNWRSLTSAIVTNIVAIALERYTICSSITVNFKESTHLGGVLCKQRARSGGSSATVSKPRHSVRTQALAALRLIVTNGFLFAKITHGPSRAVKLQLTGSLQALPASTEVSRISSSVQCFDPTEFQGFQRHRMFVSFFTVVLRCLIIKRRVSGSVHTTRHHLASPSITRVTTVYTTAHQMSAPYTNMRLSHSVHAANTKP
ncbi:hypothetical protein J6590_008362 [Homalodisca vitripennis]|nr:hypothetical protein J6590_008362 [Homalodisca vitripennis]